MAWRLAGIPQLKGPDIGLQPRQNRDRLLRCRRRCAAFVSDPVESHTPTPSLTHTPLQIGEARHRYKSLSGFIAPPGPEPELAFTRARVIRCWTSMALMPCFAVLYSLKCQSLSQTRAASHEARSGFGRPRPSSWLARHHLTGAFDLNSMTCVSGRTTRYSSIPPGSLLGHGC